MDMRFRYDAGADEPESSGLAGLDGPKALDTTCGDIVEPSLRFSPPRVTRIRTVGRRRTTARHRPSCLRTAQRDRAVSLARGDAARLGTASTTHLSLSRSFHKFSHSLYHTHSHSLSRTLSQTNTSFVEVIFVVFAP